MAAVYNENGMQSCPVGVESSACCAPTRNTTGPREYSHSRREQVYAPERSKLATGPCPASEDIRTYEGIPRGNATCPPIPLH